MGRHQPHLLVDLPERGDLEVGRETRRHMEKVLRITAATAVTYSDGMGTFGSGTYASGVVVRGEEEYRPRRLALTVAVAPPHDNSRLRFLVEKLTEVGVARLWWLKSAHREGREPRVEKVASWVQSALEQSRGAWLMEIGGSIAGSDIAKLGTPVFAQEGGMGIQDLPTISDPVLCVGPEGGFAAGEIPPGAHRLGLGDNILRVETAAVIGAAVMVNVAARP